MMFAKADTGPSFSLQPPELVVSATVEGRFLAE